MKTMIAILFTLATYGYVGPTDYTTIKVLDPAHSGKMKSCGPEGSETKDSQDPDVHDAWIGNPYKNRFILPGSGSIQIKDIAGFIATDANASKFSQGTPAKGVAVQVTGYVHDLYPGAAESCNCKTKDEAYKDTHIVLTPNDKDTSTNFVMIVEITPRMREIMKQQGVDWSTTTLHNKYINKTITVSGWLFYDLEHENGAWATNPKNNGKDPNWRASCWEIHPITSISLASGN